MNDCAHVLCRRGPRQAARRRLPAGALLALWLCAGCASSGGGQELYARLQDEDPAVRAEAAVQAGMAGDPKALPYLVDRLSDSESDVRLMAAAALRKIAGDKIADEMGWRFYDPAEVRAKARERWRRWLAARGGATAPAPRPATTPASAPATSIAPSRPVGMTPADDKQGSSKP